MPIRKYNLNQEQQLQLLEEIRTLGGELLTCRFDDPKVDEQTIRHMIYRQGKLDAYKELYEDQFPAPEPHNKSE